MTLISTLNTDEINRFLAFGSSFNDSELNTL
jgi:hypothetical protein